MIPHVYLLRYSINSINVCRPLDPAAQAYARSDTHYLLYIYDKIRNDLIDKDGGNTRLVESIFNRAADLCKKVSCSFLYKVYMVIDQRSQIAYFFTALREAQRRSRSHENDQGLQA